MHRQSALRKRAGYCALVASSRSFILVAVRIIAVREQTHAVHRPQMIFERCGVPFLAAEHHRQVLGINERAAVTGEDVGNFSSNLPDQAGIARAIALPYDGVQCLWWQVATQARRLAQGGPE